NGTFRPVESVHFHIGGGTIRTGRGKAGVSRLLALGTRADSPVHPYSLLLKQADFVADYSVSLDAHDESELYDRRVWILANPMAEVLPILADEIQDHADKAKQDAYLRPSFFGLRLNAGVADTEQEYLFEPATWKAVEGRAWREGRLVWGFDMASTGMAALAAYWPSTGTLSAIGAFPSKPGIKKLADRDSVGELYAKMKARGELTELGGHTVSIPKLIELGLERFGQPDCIVADSARASELTDALNDSDVNPCPFVIRRNADAFDDLEDFRKAVLDGHCIPEESLLLRSAISEARVFTNSSEQRKLARQGQAGRRQNARDDAIAASLVAVAQGYRWLRANGFVDEPDGDEQTDDFVVT
ncbi:MAG: hypothetical protein OXP09_21720, partial [Gammaproteobacteria bacterium]|nr:hypothetical protein [Gammaproteobacteria bacterium]MDE0368171.1 hypothetical protein [Gammaproteobacteria bacterium]